MFARLGIGGVKRLRAALQGAPPLGKHQSVPSNADGVFNTPTGQAQQRLACSTICDQKAALRLQSSGAEEETSRQYGERTAAHSTAGTSGTSSVAESGINFLQHATGDYELHMRLAALWGIPSELLFERQQTVAKMLGPAGCGTAAHALWLLVRSPLLRHSNEQAVRNSLRQLHCLVSHTEVDRAAVLMAVYKYPWILEAMSTGTPPPAVSGPHQGAAAAGSAAAGTQMGARGTPAATPTPNPSAPGTPVAPATWSQELAAVVLELQQADLEEHRSNSASSSGASSSSARSQGMSMSPGFAAAAVRTYLALGEVKQRVVGAATAIADYLLKAAPHTSAASQTGEPPATRASASPTPPCNTPQPAPTGPSGSSSPPPHHSQQPTGWPHPVDEPPSTVSEVLQRLQQQQQQHLLLEQLLAACPHLVVLPPELLLARWNRLLSVVHGCGDAASRLVMHSPYLLVDYDDVEAVRGEAQVLRQCYA